MARDEFARRRRQLMRIMGRDSIAVLPAAPVRHRNSDVEYPYRQDNDLLYLTGFADRLFKDKITLWEHEAFLDKPCSVKGLLEAVSMLVHGRTS